MTTYNHVRSMFAEDANERAWFSVPAFWLKLARHDWMMSLMQAHISRRVRAITRNVEDMSLRLSGYAYRFSRVTDTMTSEEEAEIGELVKMIEGAEAHFLDVRESILAMVQMVKPAAKVVPVLWEALTQWNIAVVEAFEAAQELRWVILECEAQHDIDQGRVHSFDSAAAAIASLRS